MRYLGAPTIGGLAKRLVLAPTLAISLIHTGCDKQRQDSPMVLQETFVYDGTTGNPVPGAIVRVYRDSVRAAPLQEAVTDSRGRAVFQLPKRVATPRIGVQWYEVACADGYSTSVTYCNALFLGYKGGIVLQPLGPAYPHQTVSGKD